MEDVEDDYTPPVDLMGAKIGDILRNRPKRSWDSSPPPSLPMHAQGMASWQAAAFKKYMASIARARSMYARMEEASQQPLPKPKAAQYDGLSTPRLPWGS